MGTLTKIVTPSTKKVKQAENFLYAKHNILSAYQTIEELVVEGEEQIEKSDYGGLLHHMLALRSELVKTLWKEEVYVGVSVIDELILQSAKNTPGAVAQGVISFLTKNHAGKPGFVLYPLHGLGIEIPPILKKDPELKPFLHFSAMGVCLSPQTNDFERGAERVSAMASRLGVAGRVEPADLRHHTEAGAMSWFTRNPLMMVKISSITGAYYENQFVYTLKIRIAAALAAMLYALGVHSGHKVDAFASSGRVNNWQTLDIKHYLIGETRGSKHTPVELRRVPMNVAALDLARLSDLTLTLSSKTLKLSFIKTTQKRLVPALKVVENGYLSHVNIKNSDKVRRRVFSRIVTALDWYRQSFSARVTDDEAVVSLAVAFETLLTDYYAQGVSNRIERRASICLKGKNGISDYITGITSVMHARGSIVHNGSSADEADIIKAQAAFALCFEAVIGRLSKLGANHSQPIADMLEDA